MPRRYYTLLTVITLAAAFLRLWQLTEVPPGLHYDLAATALLGEQVAFEGFRPIFITAYTGHEALFYYWLALWFRLAGSSIFTLRLAAAMLGVLAVPAAWFAVRQLLRLTDPEASSPMAAFGAAFVATAFFHVAFSRFGFRVITQPVVQALALGFLFRGLRLLNTRAVGAGRRPAGWVQRGAAAVRTNGLVNLALAGAFTGLAAYTYLAARLFPLPLALFWLVVVLGAWGMGRLRAAAAGLGVFTLAAGAVFAPLGVYFWQHPEDFFNRAAQVAPRPGEAGLLLLGVRRAAEMLFVSGEPYDRYNLPGLPLLNPVLGFLFVVGLLLTVRALFGPHPPAAAPHLHLAANVLLLAWTPLMLLPSALAVHDIFPSNIRAFGVLPLLMVLPARGLVAGYRALQKRWPGPLIPTAYPMAWLIMLAAALGTGHTARLYFRTWAQLPSQRLNNDADLTDLAAYLNETGTHGASLYISALHYRHPTLAYLLDDFEAVHWLTGGTSLAAPAEGPALYVFARSAPPPEAWLAEWAPYLAAAPPDPDGQPAFRAYWFEAGQTPPLPALTPLEANFANAAMLTGYTVHDAGTHLLVDLAWRIENPAPAGDFLPHARLDDAWDQPWAQSGGFNYPSEQWVPGDTLLTRLSVPLPPGLPPGSYTLKVGLYSPGTDSLLARLGAGGDYAGNRVALPPQTLAGPPATLEQFRAAHAPTPPEAARGFYYPPALLGYSLPRDQLRQGEPFELTLYWHAEQPVTVPEALAQGVLVTLGGRHLPIGERMGATTLYAGQPVRGALPFARWQPGQVVADRYVLTVPANFHPGEHELAVNVPGVGSAMLTTLTISTVPRLVRPPPVATVVEADFGGLIALHGYTLTPGPDTTLSLVWHSLAPTDRRYSVFVHVLDETGALVAQADAEPQQGRYGTPLWQPGEYVTDDYTLSLGPGAYSVRVGLYLPESGERLRVDEAGYLELARLVVP